MITPEPNVDVLLFSPDFAEAWQIGWYQPNGKWYVDPGDEPTRCLTDENCEVVRWQAMPPIPEPWRTNWIKHPY